jgi:hypothetical protein
MGTIYSVWRPDQGGFDYYEAPEAYNINDDLPTPDLVEASKIGVPSIEAGRPVPPGAVKAGSGAVARGLIAPVDASRIVRRTRPLALAGTDGISTSAKWAAGGLVAATLLVWVMRK